MEKKTQYKWRTPTEMLYLYFDVLFSKMDDWPYQLFPHSRLRYTLSQKKKIFAQFNDPV